MSGKDTADASIYSGSGRGGPSGAIRTASWSPDGARVVFHRRSNAPAPSLKRTFSRNANYELSLTGVLPAFSSSGAEFVTNSRPAPEIRGASLIVTNTATGASKMIYQDKNR